MGLFALSSLSVFFASIVFAFFLYLDNPVSKKNRAWLALSASIALWSLGLFGVTNAASAEAALLWQYLLDTAGIFIPVLLVSFVLTFLNKNMAVVRIFLWGLGILLALLSITPLFKLGVAKSATLGFFWIVPGPYYILFPMFFFSGVLLAEFYLIREYRKTTDAILRGQIKYQILAAVLGVSGGATNFFPQFFDVYPFGNYFIILYLFFISFAIFRYRLIDTKIIATQFFVGSLTLMLLFDVLRSNQLEEWLLRFFVFVVSLGLSVLLLRSMAHEAQSKRELEDLTKQLQTANSRLKVLDKQKSEFLSIATHQLRGPLTGIRGHLSLILDGSYGEVPHKPLEIIQKIFDSSGLLVQTVNDFLNVSRIEQGRMKYDMEDFAVGELISNIIEELEPVAQERKLELTFTNECAQGGCMVHADKAKLSHIFLNLIDNAIKYTEKGWVKARLLRRDGVIRFEVSDSGVGIGPDEIQALFEKFVRTAGAHTVNVNGTGLGLYVAKQMVEAHKGKIWAESKGKGKGSTFVVELPTKA